MSPALQATLKRALDYAAGQTHREVLLEHLLLALSEDEDATAVMSAASIDLGRLRNDVASYLGEWNDRIAPGAPSSPAFSSSLAQILSYATLAAKQGRRSRIDGAIVLAALIGDGRSMAASFLKAQGLTFEDAVRVLQRGVGAGPAPKPVQAPTTPAASAPGAAAMATPPAAAIHDTEDILAAARERVEQRRPPQREATSPPVQPAVPASQRPVQAAPPAPDLRPVGPAARSEPSADVSAPAAAGPDPRPAESENTGTPTVSTLPGAVSWPGGHHVPAAASLPALSELSSLAKASAPPAVSTRVSDPTDADDIRMPDPVPPGAPPRQPSATWIPPALPAHPGATAGPGRPPPVPPLQGVGARPPLPLAPPPDAKPRADTGTIPPWAEPYAYPEPDFPAAAPRTQPPVRTGPPRLEESAINAPPGLQPPIPPAPPPPAQVRNPMSPPTAAAPFPPQTAPRGSEGARIPALDAAQVTHTIPAHLRSGKAHPVEVRIARTPMAAVRPGAAPAILRPELVAARAISVRLRGGKSGFAIEATSPETQWDQASGTTGRLSSEAAVWRFVVTPQSTGRSDLQIIVTARTVGADGVMVDAALPDQSVPVRVGSNLARTAMTLAKVVGIGLAAIVAVEIAEGITKVELHATIARLLRL